MSTPLQGRSPFVLTSKQFPSTLPELCSTLSKMYVDVAKGINVSTNGIYQVSSGDAGQQVQEATRNTFVEGGSVNALRRQTYRQVYPLDSIANGTNTIPIYFPPGASLNASSPPLSQFVHIYGCANDPTTAALSVPLPHVNLAAPADGIQLQVDWTVPQIVVITTTANWVNYNAIIVIEYIL